MIKILDKVIEYSLYILIFSIPLSNTLIEVSAIIAISCYFLKRIFMHKTSFVNIVKPVKTPINTPVIIFLGISFLSIFWSTYPEASLRAFIRKWIEYILLFFIMAETMNSKTRIRNLIVFMALTGAIVGIDGIVQRITGLDFVRGYNMMPPPRIRASFKFTGGLSSWLTIMIFPFLSIFIFYKNKKSVKILSGVLAIILISCLMMTFSKGAILGFFVALLTMLLFKAKNKKKIISILLICLLLFVVFVHFSPRHIKTSFMPSAPAFHDRAYMWKTAFNMISDRPLLGQGLNTFMANYKKFNPLEGHVYGSTVSYAHNCYLQIPAEIGIFGLIAFLGLIFAMIRDSLNIQRVIKDSFLETVHLGLFCGLLAFLIHSAFEVSLYSLRLAMIFWCSLGVLMAVSNLTDKNAAKKRL